VSERVDILREFGDEGRLLRFWRSVMVVVENGEASGVEEVVSEETRLEIRKKIGACVQYALVD
jgi:hypothetical protein